MQHVSTRDVLEIMSDEPCHAPAHYLRLLKRHNPHLARTTEQVASADRRCRLPRKADRSWAATGPDLASHSESSSPQASLRETETLDSHDGSEAQKNGTFDSRIAAAVGLSELTATEQCPYCSRRFSREAAARHIPICAGLKSRPKPPKEHAVYFTDQLGRRQASPNSAAGDSGGFSFATRSRPRMVWPESPSRPDTVESARVDHDGLQQQWSLVQFLLRDGLEALASDKTILATTKTAEECLEFLDTLEDYSKKLGMRKGALSRLLLPFNADTDSGDQANSAMDTPLGSSELDGLMTDRERQELVQRAVALRRLVRVKVADCADIEQARESLKLIVEFLDGLQKAAAQEKRSLASILREL
eukprot:Skav228028  [mRNA]  locus=scaffold1073:215189:216271:- [translate_table: standard]